MKKILFVLMSLVSTLTMCVSCGSSKQEVLENRAEDFLNARVGDLVVVSSTSVDAVEAQLRNWGVQLEEKHDVIMVEVEGYNIYGGIVNKNYLVFFINEQPVDYADASNVNKMSVRSYIDNLRWMYGW